MSSTSGLVTVLRGSMTEVLLAQGLLDGLGYRTFVPDAQVKTIDPFITGSNVFEVELQVPAEQEARAREALQSWKAKPSAAPSPPSDEPRDASGYFAWASRYQWLLWITALLLALLYLNRCHVW